jgi:hypothetical protein
MTRSTGRRQFRSSSPAPTKCRPAPPPATAPWASSCAATASDYSIEINGLSAITGAHLHSGAAGVNGPIRIALYPGPGSNFSTTPSARFDGQFYEGSFEASDVTGISFSDLVAGMRAGTVYGNVHTSAFPGGEIRGQVQVVSSQLIGARGAAHRPQRGRGRGVRSLGHGVRRRASRPGHLRERGLRIPRR